MATYLGKAVHSVGVDALQLSLPPGFREAQGEGEGQQGGQGDHVEGQCDAESIGQGAE